MKPYIFVTLLLWFAVLFEARKKVKNGKSDYLYSLIILAPLITWAILLLLKF